jgi:acyl transferase domain-containing protein
LAFERIAIVGVGGVFPGATSLADFWRNILAGRSASREVPPGRWTLPPEEAFDPTPARPDKVYSTRGCIVEATDGEWSGLAADAAWLAQLDPLFHFALAAGKQAYADAAMTNVDPQRVGVILGNIALPTEASSAIAADYLNLPFVARLFPDRATKPRSSRYAARNRYVTGLPAGVLAKALGLGGGSFTLDAACASSLYAIKFAVDELRAGRLDAVLAGGINRPDCLYTQMGFSQLHALSPSGVCSPFDVKADGLVVGEGAGVFVLKRLSDALAMGDHIYGVIAGIGLSNDVGGRLLAPDSEGQLRAMRSAYAEADWSPADVDLIECHATGTPVGDAVEFESLVRLSSSVQRRGPKCAIGSVKSNVGHLLTGAGAAGLMKVLWS